MHETSVFVLNLTSFSEKDWGKDTAIYLKLIKELSEDRWTTFYSAVKLTTEITDELKALPKTNPEPPLQDDPEGYHIWDSDPIDSSEDLDIDIE